MRRGITPVVAIALLLGMTVAASGGAYTFFTSATQQSMDEASASLATSTEVRSMRCGDTSAVVGISNTGDRELVTDAATAFLYRDGDLVDTVEKDVSGADMLQPGGFTEFEFPFTTYLEPGTGYEVEVSFANTDHTVERNCQAQTGDLVGYWNFDSIESRTIRDAAGEANDGTFHGMELNGTFEGIPYNGTRGGSTSSESTDPTWATDCNSGGCLAFDGNDDIVDIGDVPVGNNFTVAAWVNLDALTGADDGIIGFDGSQRRQFDFNDATELRYFDSDLSPQSTTYTVTPSSFEGQWRFVAVKRNGSTTTLYIDGEAVTSNEQSGTATKSFHQLGLSQTSDSQYFNGKIDELHLYNRTLGDTELQSVMDGGFVRDELIAYYPMDEDEGQEVYNSAFQAEGQRGQAVQFDGADDCVPLPDILPSSSPKSAGGWFNLNDISTSQRILSIRGSARILLVAGDSSNGALDIWQSGNWHRGIGTISADTWTHLFMTDDGSTVRLYKDGEEIATFSSSPQNGGNRDSIGCDWGGVGNGWADYTDGSIDDVRIYDRALSRSEIQDDMNGDVPKDGIVAYYSMDGPTGNTVWNNAFWQEGRTGGALLFDGTDDWMEATDSAELNPTRISYGAWFRPDTIEVGHIMKKCCVSGSSIWLRLNPGGNISAGSRIDGTFQSVVAESVAAADEWTHAFYTYNGSTARLYIDGALAESTPATGDVNSTSGEAVTIGSSQNGGNYFPGTIDDARIYDTALTADQVAALYNATR